MTAPANADNKALSGLGFLSRIARNKNFGRIFAISLAVAAVVSGAATYATLAGSKSFDDSPAIVLLLLNVDLVLSLLLAFLIARRIVCPLEVGESVKRGFDFGMIRFGSQTEIIIPARDGVAFKSAVKVGDKVHGGKTVLGDWID